MRRTIPSGTLLCLTLVALMVAGGVWAVRPRLTPHWKERKRLARAVGAAVRARHPQASIQVVADYCPGGHRADLVVHVNRNQEPGELQQEADSLTQWLHAEFPEAFLRELVLSVNQSNRQFQFDHP